MLARRYRLPTSIRFPRNATFITDDYLFKWTTNALSYSRFGFIVRKTLDKRATRRNRVKRLLRSCVEELQKQIVPGYDMLFLLKQGIMGKTRRQLLDELKQTLKKNRLLKIGE